MTARGHRRRKDRPRRRPPHKYDHAVAWRAEVYSGEVVAIVSARSRGAARCIVRANGNDAGYPVQWSDIVRCVRAMEFDEWAARSENYGSSVTPESIAR